MKSATTQKNCSREGSLRPLSFVGIFILKEKFGDGTIVDNSRDYTAVNGV